MGISLVLLAEGAAFDIAANKRGEAGPPEFGGDEVTRFQEAGVTGRRVIVAAFQDGPSERVIRRNIDTALIREDASVDLPVSQTRTEGERNILVHGLESLEDEGVTRGGRFDAVGEGGVNKVDKERRR